MSQAAGAARAKTVIGIHDGHNAAVALLRDGELKLAIQEERVSRIKNQGDVPVETAKLALEMATGDGSEIASGAGSPTGADVQVALNGHYMNYGQWDRETVIRDYAESGGFLSRMKQPLKNTFVDRAYQRRREQEREARLAALGIDRSRITPVEHHQAHASAAYYTSPFQEGRCLVLTCDGSGDRLSATVSIGENGTLERIAEISEHDSIGRLYALVTRAMGMVPLEHEYKVMGLAPYAGQAQGAQAIAQGFRDLFEFSDRNPLVWTRRSGVPSMYAAYGLIDRMLHGQRFDWVAGGTQAFMEGMLTEWVRRAVHETGIRRLACAGGVFMNVKANLAILELDEVEEMYVLPSCGDESNSIGAACAAAARLGEKIQPLGGIYFGEPITDGEAQLALEEAARKSNQLRFHWHGDIERTTAEKLSEGKIVARAKGAVEFGARALGNRSILARADSPNAVRTINHAIKNRDFWMPFAPSVLAERADDYYEKPKPVASSYMMFAFRSRKEKRGAYPAAQHPYDFTTRGHEVTAEHNADYHRLLQEYESITGEGILLNTSFNLHGEPIVYRASDAIDVFLRSGLEHMALSNWWVEKAR